MLEPIVRIFDPADRFVSGLFPERSCDCGLSACRAVRSERTRHGVDAKVRPDRARRQFHFRAILIGGAPPHSCDDVHLEGNARKFAMLWP